MLTITVNGSEKKLNIGCRTFVALDEMVNLLETAGQKVTLNGTVIRSQEFAQTFVKGGDNLGFK